MNLNFCGTFSHTLDPRNRMFIPVEFREDLGENFLIFKSPDGCLKLYTTESWNEVREKLNKEANTRALRNRNTVIFSWAASCRMDKQGRITIAAEWLEHAAITKEVTVVGAGNGIELWSPERLKELEANMDEEALLNIFL